MVGADGNVGGTGQSRVNSEVEGGDGVATGCTLEAGCVGASGIDGLSIPGVWQLVGTDCCISGASQCRCYGEVESGNGVTASNTYESSRINSSGIDGLSVPGVRQLFSADGGIGGTGYRRANS